MSVSELAEFAYCPRALYYRHHPPPVPIDRAATVSAQRGVEFHRRTLERVRARAEGGLAGPIAAVVVGLLLLAVLITFGLP